jgi:hypothetical protein
MRLFNWLKNFGKKETAPVNELPTVCKCGKKGLYCTVYNDQKYANGYAYTETLCLGCMKTFCERGCIIVL